MILRRGAKEIGSPQGEAVSFKCEYLGEFEDIF
jgi:hypothetical protein